jgi:hypothetical protein
VTSARAQPAPARPAAAALLAVAWLLAAAGPGRADEPAPLPVKLAAVKGRAVASLDLTAAFSAVKEQELGNGLTNLVEIYTTVQPAEGGPATALHGRMVEILFDVWEETYSVTVKDPEHPAGRRLVIPTFAALRSFLGQQREVDLGPVSALPERFAVEVRVEVNPVSKEQLQRTREYIAAAAGSRPSGSRSVLGAVASFLLREPNAGSDVRLLRSAPLARGAVAAR